MIRRLPVISDQVEMVDLLRLEEIALHPGRIGDRHPLGEEFDVPRIEIELEIARDPHLTLGLAGDDPFEGVLEEAPLGDEQDRPGQHEQAEQGGEDGDARGDGGAECAGRSRGGGFVSHGGCNPSASESVALQHGFG